MMRVLAMMLLFAGLTVACADRPPRDGELDRSLAEQDRQDRREQERLCQIYADTGRHDPRCPTYPQPRSGSDPIAPPPLPPLPPTR